MNTKQPTQYCTVARIVESGQAVVILQHGPDRCYVRQCYGTDVHGRKEYGIETKKLREF